MPPLPVISGRHCVKALEKIGFFTARHTGSHIILRRADPPTTLPVPDHKELAPGTLRSIIRQAGLSVAEFIALL
ncbi:MAG: type II toxin-antitoxin system HicA family toxin [Anaerolineae bacterium]|nr:type II toxin-antitoxin system HicA family toxin [Anaerolineae bacterium]